MVVHCSLVPLQIAIDVTQGTEWELFVSFVCLCVYLNSCSPCHVPELVYGIRNIIICVQAFNVIIQFLLVRFQWLYYTEYRVPTHLHLITEAYVVSVVLE